MIFGILSISFLLIAVGIVGLKKYKTLFNPFSLFNFIFALTIIMVPLAHNYGVDYPSKTARLMLFVGILCFNFGFAISRLFKKHSNILLSRESIDESKMRIIINLLCCLMLIVSFANGIPDAKAIFVSGQASEIRDSFFSQDTSIKSIILYYLRIFVSLPLVYAFLPLSILELYKKNKNWFLIITEVFCILLSVLTSAGRLILINSLIVLFFFIFSKRKDKNAKKSNILGFIVSLLAIAGVLFLTSVRPIEESDSNLSLFEKVYKTLYIYFSSNVSYFGSLIEKYPLQANIAYGANSIAGFINPFLAMLAFLGVIKEYPKNVSFVDVATTESLKIGPYYSQNAFPTAFYYYYMDFGLAGVVIESLVFGFVCMSVYKKYLSNKNGLFCSSFAALISVYILTLPLKHLFYSPSYALSFVYLLIIQKMCKTKGKEIDYESTVALQ